MVHATMYLRLSHDSGAADFAIALSHVDGPPIRPRLTYKCRLDQPNFPDRDCSQGPSASRVAAAYTRTRMRYPKNVGQSVRTIYPAATGQLPDYRFYEHQYEWRAFTKPTPQAGDDDYFDLSRKPLQTDRFICRRGVRDSDPDFVDCSFP
jgi:hypothetical protein